MKVVRVLSYWAVYKESLIEYNLSTQEIKEAREASGHYLSGSGVTYLDESI
jgi:hypothetical protein